MAVNRDFDTLLKQTFFGLDILTMLGDVEDFIEFSENNIRWQKQRELRRAEHERNDEVFDDPLFEVQYRDQALRGVEYRFEISLTQRVRYATLITLITTIEWVLVALKKRASFEFPKKPEKMNEAVHALTVFNDKAALRLEQEIHLLKSLIQIRNCIVHSAGLLASYKHGSELRRGLVGLSGVGISSKNFLGESIEIEAGFLEEIINNTRIWLPAVETALIVHGLFFNGTNPAIH
ncbi:hypothetical protein [Rhodoferax sp.]|uniref:hypothetical protein n=1 Tax=Rhodoferax sp. TaxID=50421 RepID=UPI0027327866|nr:hypothetical protein [Rhodoferax sp.]MDP3191041.1 hypothetical protein [Rhodoferax sp.]MDP3864369.1 hypothetical protein [Rhodoferax sp.]